MSGPDSTDPVMRAEARRRAMREERPPAFWEREARARGAWEHEDYRAVELPDLPSARGCAAAVEMWRQEWHRRQRLRATREDIEHAWDMAEAWELLRLIALHGPRYDRKPWEPT